MTRRANKSLQRVAVPLHNFERNIDAILQQIDRHILPEIRQLQRGAGGVGKPLPLGVAIAAQIQHQPAHRIRRIAAVAEQLVPVAIAGRRSGPARRRGSDRRTARCGMPCARTVRQQRDEDRMLRVARRTCASSSPRHQASRRRLSAVSPISSPRSSAQRQIGVDVVEILVQALGQQEADDVEILVMVGGEPARVGRGLGSASSVRPAPRATERNRSGEQVSHAALRNDRRLQVAVVAHQVAHHFEQVVERLFAIDEVAEP